MRKVRIALGVVLAGLTILVLLLNVERPQPKLYRGGPILTLDADNRVVEALAVDFGRIVAAGSEAELASWIDSAKPEIVDLEGRALLPGFIDAHGHFPGAGIGAVFVDLNSPPIGGVTDIEGLVGKLSARAAETSEGEWVIGIGYDDTLLADKRHPTRHDLDRASTRHPIGVLHISGHLGVANSAGLAASGIDAETPDPEGGLIRREPAGREPDGVLEETAMLPLQRHLVPSAGDGLRILDRAGKLYAAAGVTTAQSGSTDAKMLSFFDWVSWLGLVPQRLIVWPTPEAAVAMLSGKLDPPSGDPERLRVGAVKIIADGSIQGYTGYLSEPYYVTPADDLGYRGYPRVPRDKLIEQVGAFHAAGMQVAVHGNGDASIDDILDAFEAAQEAHPRDDARHVIIHAQMTRMDQLDRMHELGVIPSFFSLHTFYWGDRHRQIFMGPERAARMSPAASAVERDVRFTLHADAPVVPMEPLRLIWAAVNRKTRSGFTVGPAERITPLQALRAVTIDAAWQHFEEDEKGSLEVGKLADLVILSRSPLVGPETIDDIVVLETVVGGRTIYRAPAAPGS
jgi:predicted amidohydrolase YtcJ